MFAFKSFFGFVRRKSESKRQRKSTSFICKNLNNYFLQFLLCERKKSWKSK